MNRCQTLLALACLVGCVGAPPPPPGTGDASGDGGSSETGASTGPVETSSASTEDGAEGTTGTTEEPPTAGICARPCADDLDCSPDGEPSGLVCIDELCTALGSCTSDGQCVAELSHWGDGAPCSLPAECIDSEACIGVSGRGHCVPREPTEGCERVGLDPIPLVDVQGERVVVCGRADASCGDDGLCAAPCQGDDDCATTPATPLCDTSSGRCRCDADEQCREGGAGDRCVGGRCGCTDDSACEGPSPVDGRVCVPR